MPNLDTLHNELRVEIPNKTYELYNDVLRWAINEICVKTANWLVVTKILTEEGDDGVYDIDLPTGTVIHSNLYIIQKGVANTSNPDIKSADRVIMRATNGSVITAFDKNDYVKTFKTFSRTKIQIIPPPKDGGINLEVYTAVKPISGTTAVAENKFFEEYKDIVVAGALQRLYKLDGNIDLMMLNQQEFRNGIDSIHVDVIKQNANTPLRVSASW